MLPWRRRGLREKTLGMDPGLRRGNRLQILRQTAVKVRAAVAEEAEGGAVALHSGEVDGRGQHSGLLRAELGEHVAALVADEAVAVEMLAAFVADPVGGSPLVVACQSQVRRMTRNARFSATVTVKR